MTHATIAAPADDAMAQPERLLDPIARTSEMLFGLIMALTFTATFGVATADRDEVRLLMVGIIGCNIAWGVVDAVMFLMSTLSERGRGLVTVRAVHAAPPAEAHRIITEAMPPVLASLLARGDLEKLRRGLLDMRDLPAKASLTREDWLGAFAVFLLVLLSTFPIVVPFLLFDQAYLALRVSNAIAIVMLFVLGYQLGQHSGHHPLRTGFGMVTIGLVLVGLAVALGG